MNNIRACIRVHEQKTDTNTAIGEQETNGQHIFPPLPRTTHRPSETSESRAVGGAFGERNNMFDVFRLSLRESTRVILPGLRCSLHCNKDRHHWGRTLLGKPRSPVHRGSDQERKRGVVGAVLERNVPRQRVQVFQDSSNLPPPQPPPGCATNRQSRHHAQKRRAHSRRLTSTTSSTSHTHTHVCM